MGFFKSRNRHITQNSANTAGFPDEDLKWIEFLDISNGQIHAPKWSEIKALLIKTEQEKICLNDLILIFHDQDFNNLLNEEYVDASGISKTRLEEWKESIKKEYDDFISQGNAENFSEWNPRNGINVALYSQSSNNVKIPYDFEVGKVVCITGKNIITQPDKESHVIASIETKLPGNTAEKKIDCHDYQQYISLGGSENWDNIYYPEFEADFLTFVRNSKGAFEPLLREAPVNYDEEPIVKLNGPGHYILRRHNNGWHSLVERVLNESKRFIEKEKLFFKVSEIKPREQDEMVSTTVTSDANVDGNHNVESVLYDFNNVDNEQSILFDSNDEESNQSILFDYSTPVPLSPFLLATHRLLPRPNHNLTNYIAYIGKYGELLNDETQKKWVITLSMVLGNNNEARVILNNVESGIIVRDKDNQEYSLDNLAELELPFTLQLPEQLSIYCSLPPVEINSFFSIMIDTYDLKHNVEDEKNLIGRQSDYCQILLPSSSKDELKYSRLGSSTFHAVIFKDSSEQWQIKNLSGNFPVFVQSADQFKELEADICPTCRQAYGQIYSMNNPIQWVEQVFACPVCNTRSMTQLIQGDKLYIGNTVYEWNDPGVQFQE